MVVLEGVAEGQGGAEPEGLREGGVVMGEGEDEGEDEDEAVLSRPVPQPI